MVAPEVQGIDLFKIAGRSISGWVPASQLASIEAKKLAPPKLPKATPDAEPDRPVRVVPVHTMQEKP